MSAGPGPRTGPTSRRSATRRRRTPSFGPGSASASRFFAFGLVLFIYEFWLNHPDDAPMDPVLARFRPADREPAQGWQVFPRRRGGAAGADRRRHDHGARLLRPAQLLRHRAARNTCRSISCATCISRRRSSGSACRGSAPGCSWPRHRRRARGARPGLAGRPAVLGDAGDRRRRADRQLARHHGLHRTRAGSGSATRACPISSSAGSGRSASSSGC